MMESISVVAGLSSDKFIYGGLTIAVVGLIWLVYKLGRLFFNHATEVIQRNTDASIAQAVSNQKMVDTLDSLGRVIETHISK